MYLTDKISEQSSIDPYLNKDLIVLSVNQLLRKTGGFVLDECQLLVASIFITHL